MRRRYPKLHRKEFTEWRRRLDKTARSAHRVRYAITKSRMNRLASGPLESLYS
jgi:hypothetical protein